MYNSIESIKKTSKIDIDKLPIGVMLNCELCGKNAIGKIIISKDDYSKHLQLELCKQCLRTIKAMIAAIV